MIGCHFVCQAYNNNNSTNTYFFGACNFSTDESTMPLLTSRLPLFFSLDSPKIATHFSEFYCAIVVFLLLSSMRTISIWCVLFDALSILNLTAITTKFTLAFSIGAGILSTDRFFDRRQLFARTFVYNLKCIMLALYVLK